MNGSVCSRSREAPELHRGGSAMDDSAIVALVTRLARPHPSGGRVIERAAVMAAGSDSPAVIAWIISHSGVPETPPVAPSRRDGLHGSRFTAPTGDCFAPRRYVLPAGVLLGA